MAKKKPSDGIPANWVMTKDGLKLEQDVAKQDVAAPDVEFTTNPLYDDDLPVLRSDNELRSIKEALNDFSERVSLDTTYIPNVRASSEPPRQKNPNAWTTANISSSSNSFQTAYGGNSPVIPRPQRSNMDGGMERKPDCTGFWIEVEVLNHLNPVSTRLVSVRYRGGIDPRYLEFRYIDEVDDNYSSIDAIRQGKDILYVFLWEPEEM